MLHKDLADGPAKEKQRGPPPGGQLLDDGASDSLFFANRLVCDQIWVMMACQIPAKLVADATAKRSQE
jgi:hypothetical protein